MGTIEKHFKKGAMIIREGSITSSFYIISQGEVEVLKDKDGAPVRIAVLGPGEFFGETSLLDPDNNTHCASIRAIEDTTIEVMSRLAFEKYIGTLTPGLRKLLQKMAIRLREANQRDVMIAKAQADTKAEAATVQTPPQELPEAGAPEGGTEKEVGGEG